MPAPTPVASPALFTVATVVLDDCHVAVEVTVAVEPSLYVAVAANCCVPPVATVAVAGVTVMLDTVFAAAVTSSVARAVKLPSVAVMVTAPAAIAVARPEPFTVATAVFDELQLMPEVGVAVVPLLYVAVAVNCCVVPTVTETVAGERESAVMVTDAAFTVRSVDPLTPLSEAATVAEPAATPVAMPLVLTVAIAVFDELHATDAVTFAVEPSLYAPVAVNCSVPLTAMPGFAGVIAIAVRLLGVFVCVEVDEPLMRPPPQPVPATMRREEARERIRTHK